MEKDSQKNVVNHFEAGSNCQVFNGNITGCVFAMPGSTVTQQATEAVTPQDDEQPQKVAIHEELANSEYWQKLKDAGLVDEHGQPTVSRPEAALMVYVLAKRLHIVNKWKLFERLWHRNNMRNDYNTALNQQKSLEFQEKLKNILG